MLQSKFDILHSIVCFFLRMPFSAHAQMPFTGNVFFSNDFYAITHIVFYLNTSLTVGHRSICISRLWNDLITYSY